MDYFDFRVSCHPTQRQANQRLTSFVPDPCLWSVKAITKITDCRQAYSYTSTLTILRHWRQTEFRNFVSNLYPSFTKPLCQQNHLDQLAKDRDPIQYLGRSKDLVQTSSFDNPTLEAIDQFCLWYQKGYILRATYWWNQYTYFCHFKKWIYLLQFSPACYPTPTRRTWSQEHLYPLSLFGDTDFYFWYSSRQNCEKRVKMWSHQMVNRIALNVTG